MSLDEIHIVYYIHSIENTTSSLEQKTFVPLMLIPFTSPVMTKTLGMLGFLLNIYISIPLYYCLSKTKKYLYQFYLLTYIMELRCKHCKYIWDYKGKSKYYCSCPRCMYKINIKNNIEGNK